TASIASALPSDCVSSATCLMRLGVHRAAAASVQQNVTRGPERSNPDGKRSPDPAIEISRRVFPQDSNIEVAADRLSEIHAWRPYKTGELDRQCTAAVPWAATWPGSAHRGSRRLRGRGERHLAPECILLTDVNRTHATCARRCLAARGIPPNAL